MNLTRDDVIDILRHDLPRLVEEYPDLRHALAGTLSDVFVRKEELYDVLSEIKELRSDFNRGFQEYGTRLEELREDFNRRMDEHSQQIEELREDFNRRFEEHSRILAEHSQRIEEHSQRIEVLVESVKSLESTLKSSIGALGARWGIMSEHAFREGLRGILKTTGWKVERFWDIDTEGIVFGRPEQIELDVAISDGELILIEIKSSIDIDNIYTFQRKVAFYEKFKGVTVTRRAVISPFVEDYAGERARELGIEVYTSGVEFRPIRALE